MDHSQHSMDATSHAGHSMAAINPAAPGVTAGAHDKHAGHSVAMFRDKFWLSLALSIPVVIWSRDPQKWLQTGRPGQGSPLGDRRLVHGASPQPPDHAMRVFDHPA
jgi:hypothetical protein